MTTQTDIRKANQAVEALPQAGKPVWPLAAAVLILLSLVGGAVLVAPSFGAESANDLRALEAISDRYQGMAEAYAAAGDAGSLRALEVLSSRYQAQADLYASGTGADSLTALAILSSRYQGMADIYAAGTHAAAMRALAIISDRYQAQADLYKE